jgi:SHOCT-like protein
MPTSEERQQILQMINEGQINADQGAELLSALNAAADTPEPEVDATPASGAPPNFSNLWLIPMGVGIAILIVGGLMLSSAYQAGGWFSFVCGWPLFAIGLVVIVAAWFARVGPWVHVSITHDKKDQRDIKISLPLNPAVFILKIVRPFVPRVKDTAIDEVLMSMKDNVNRDQPLYVDVNEAEDGERIQVLIG